MQKLQNEFLEKYPSLHINEQIFLQVLSVFYSEASLQHMAFALRYMLVRTEKGQFIQEKDLPKIIKKLGDLAFIASKKGQKTVVCRKEIVELAARQAMKEGRLARIVEVVQKCSPPPYLSNSLSSPEEVLKYMRLSLFGNDAADARSYVSAYAQHSGSKPSRHPYLEIIENPFDKDWFLSLSPEIVQEVLVSVLSAAFHQLDSGQRYFELLKEYWTSVDPEKFTYLGYFLGAQYLWRGMPEKALDTLHPQNSIQNLALQGWTACLTGNAEQSTEKFEKAIALVKKQYRSSSKKITMGGYADIFYSLALLKVGDLKSLEKLLAIAEIIFKEPQNSFCALFIPLRRLALIRSCRFVEAMKQSKYNDPLFVARPDDLFLALFDFWLDGAEANILVASLASFAERAESAGYLWLAETAIELLSRLSDNGHFAEKAARLRETIGAASIVDLLKPQESWDLVLDAISNLGRPEDSLVNQGETDKRLVWMLDSSDEYFSLEPKEQKIKARGGWTLGRAVALKRLVEEINEMPHLTAQDRSICACIKPERESGYYGYYGRLVYAFDRVKAIRALIGHPLVFWGREPAVRVEIVKGEPELKVVNKKNRIAVELSPRPINNETLVLVKETPTRVRVVEFNQKHLELAALLGKGFSAPKEAEKKILDTISAISSVVTIHSDIGAAVEDAEEVAADSRPHIHLRPFSGGLKMQLMVRPFGEKGPYCLAGSGGATVVAEIGGRRFQTTRDLDLETNQAKTALAFCPVLEYAEDAEGEWTLPDPEESLELLLQLRTLGEKVIIEWPEGETLKVTPQATMAQFKMNISSNKDWFAASGELILDEELVLDMGQLLKLIQKNPGRFIPLEDGKFLALTSAFRKRLDDLASFGEADGKGVRFHPLASLAMEDVVSECGAFKSDKKWKEQIKRFNQAMKLEPKIPSTLQAELRDYQIDGYKWLARLAHWGVGACLADDMGLGKTVQALTMILAHAQEGPSIVIAPTSVCMNWHDEVRRFAPTITAINFGDGNREETLNNLKPFDLVVTSYGLLQNEAEKLSSIQWQTVVLDEAQAIKNMSTKRSQAAMALKAKFKIIATGTPIENHLGELWNLFHFLNPGLLGSYQKFNARFGIPIEKNSDKKVKEQLKKLINPFILRRKKSEVLEELPPKTEICLHVELSKEETAMYEALRLQSLERLSNIANEQGSKGQKHLMILAEIMKLRRAASNPKLVLPDFPITSAKLETFGAVLEELLESGHKALVFSQFVDHLQIIREYLEKKGVAYQYLDGSTPAKDRRKHVEAFQAGQGDIFLISLKAGGSGLNLTAADYVIHMDPWWNPAVEDQASDRVHRIGQKRPVTIYRLVAKNTIEEQIVDLHKHKRNLAEGLLEGADGGGKLSAEDLMRLIRGE